MLRLKRSAHTPKRRIDNAVYIDNIVLILLLVTQFALAGWLMWKSPYNPLSIVGMLTTAFSFLPAMLYLDGAGFESYSWRNFTLLDVTNAANAAILIGIMNSCLLIGAGAAQCFRPAKARLIADAGIAAREAPRGEFLYNSKKLGLVSVAYLLLWTVIAAVLYRQSGQTLTQFLLPIKQTGIAAEQSGYLRSLFLAIPSALVVMNYWRHGKLTSWGWMWVVLALLSTFSTHQRRELVTTALLLLSLGLFLRPLRQHSATGANADAFDPAKHAKRMRLIILVVLTAGLMLVPLLWYARVYFTNLDQGDSVNAFEVRSFQDILFGSPSTGFPTFVYIQEFVSEFGTAPLYLLAYPLTIFIPRALWGSKPTDLDTLLENQFWLVENPSSFWFGEMYYGFGYLAPLATLLLAFGMYRLCMKCQTANDVWFRTLGALLFMQCVTLFKNGITVFIIGTSVLVVLLALAWVIAKPAQRAGSGTAPEARSPIPI